MEPLSRLQPFLRDDEQLLWHGAPDPRVLFTSRDLYMIPFSILWCGFAFFLEARVVTSGGPVLSELWGVPFVCVGLYMVFGRFIYKRYRNSRTEYGITTRRAMIADPRTFRDLPLHDAQVTIRRSGSGGHASVEFGGSVPSGFFGSSRRSKYAFYANTGMELLARSAYMPFAFYDVASPEAMLQALDQARLQAST